MNLKEAAQYWWYGTYATKQDAEKAARHLRSLPGRYKVTVSKKGQRSEQFGTYWNVYTNPRIADNVSTIPRRSDIKTGSKLLRAYNSPDYMP